MGDFRTNNAALDSAAKQSTPLTVHRLTPPSITRRRAGILTVFLLLAVSFLGGCEDDPFASTEPGTLRVLVSGHSPSLANAGELRYTSDDGNLVLPIPVSGMLEQTAPAGTYHVTYVPPSGYTLAAGQTPERDVTITAGQITEITFHLVASQSPTGLVRVTVSGLAAGASAGGSALVERTDVSGQAPASMTIPSGGSAELQVVTGTYNVTYMPPSNYQLVSGQTNPRSVTVTQNGTATASFQVQASSGGSTVQALFFSDWRTQSGNSETAISDGGKWNWMSDGAGQNGSIIDAPAGFSTHRVLRVETNGYRDGWLAPTVTTLGEIPVGTTRNYRWEHAFHEPALADAGQHPIQDGGAVSQSNWYMSTINGGGSLAAGQWGLDYIFGGNPSWDHSKFTLGSREGQFTPLQKGRVYRHEIQIARISTSQFRFHVWIHDAAGNLLYDSDDFRSRDGGTPLTNYTHTFNNVGNTSIFLIGLNGIGNSPPWPIHSSDQAAFAVVQGLPERQQIGPYGSVQGEIRR